jgi:beta-mannosidase
MEIGVPLEPEVGPVAAKVPGSVQLALLEAGILDDWNAGLGARACEWVEHRHWVYHAQLPDEWTDGGNTTVLHADGLDYCGYLYVNGREVGSFVGTLVPHRFSIGPYLRETANQLAIVFTENPYWLGQIGFTSRMTQWKPRFNYGWDWTPRLVQIGVCGALGLHVHDTPSIADLRCRASCSEDGGVLSVQCVTEASASRHVRVSLAHETTVIHEETIVAHQAGQGVLWKGLPIRVWWPNGHGDQPLYTVVCELLNGVGETVDRAERTVGFKHVEWRRCEGSPASADPWLCVVNGTPVFLQGINWTPIRPNFADVTPEEVDTRLHRYRDMGCTVLRVWGGAPVESEHFYETCDRLGLLVWQEFPLSSSGIDNWPPEDPTAIDEIAAIAQSYVRRRRHHVSLLMWCGGNELQGGPDGDKQGIGKPVDCSHPMLARLARVVQEEDPERRFVPTSSSGPRFGADAAEFGKGVHWDVHGPWKVEGPVDESVREYWRNDDALFRSEVGCPGASPVSVIRSSAGALSAEPVTNANPLWRRSSWWTEDAAFAAEHGRPPSSLEEYVTWSQARQATVLRLAAESCKRRFPRMGGIIFWMGHDCFPCTANTSVLDVHGDPKPAADAIAQAFHRREW